MTVLKCLVGLSDGMVVTCDGIKHEGKLWLVPRWIEHPTEPFAMPERIIRFDCFAHQPGQGDGLDYQNIQLPIPESALLGPVPSGIEFEDHPRNLSVHIHESRRQ